MRAPEIGAPVVEFTMSPSKSAGEGAGVCARAAGTQRSERNVNQTGGTFIQNSLADSIVVRWSSDFRRVYLRSKGGGAAKVLRRDCRELGEEPSIAVSGRAFDSGITDQRWLPLTSPARKRHTGNGIPSGMSKLVSKWVCRGRCRSEERRVGKECR